MRLERDLPALRAELRPSIELGLLLAAAHIGAGATVLYVLESTSWAVAVCSVIAIEGCWVIGRHALLRFDGAVVGLDLPDGDGCVLRLGDRDVITGRIAPSTYVTPWLIVLHVRRTDGRGQRRVVIWRDSVAPAELRRLRVRLRWAWSGTQVPGRAEAPL